MRSLTHVRNACVALVFALSLPLYAQTLPPPPPTVAEAVKSCNDLAYGFPKNTVAYWETLPYASDPLYFYKRMCGWQSEGGRDQAPFGLYAVPPSAWRIVVDPGPNPEPTVALETRIATLEHGAITLGEKIDYLLDRLEELKARVVVLEGRTLFTSCRATVFGIPISCKLVP